MALIPYGASLDCTCSPASATGAAIETADTSYRPATFTYNSDGSIGVSSNGGINDNAVPVDSASYPAFRIDNNANIYYYVFCYRSGGHYSSGSGLGFFDAGIDRNGAVDCSSTRFPNEEVSACCSCCCGSNSDDFITTPDANTALSVTDPATCPSRQTTTTPGGRGGD